MIDSATLPDARSAGIPIAAIAILLALTVAVPVALRLATIPSQYPLRQWLVAEPSTLVPLPLPLDYVGIVEGTDAFRVELSTSDLPSLLRYEALEPLLGTAATPAVLVEGWIAVAGTSCRFATEPLTTLADNQPIRLHRLPACETLLRSTPPDQTALTLEMRLVRGSGQITVWTLQDPSGAPRLLSAPPLKGVPLAVRGFGSWMAPASSMTRADLLAAVWMMPLSTVWAIVALGAGLLGLAGGFVSVADRAASRAGAAVLSAAGVGALFAGLSLVHMLATPPLQVADEPDHLLSFGYLTARSTLAGEAAALARRIHFERLRHHGEEHLQAADLTAPWPVAWRDVDVFVEPTEARTPLMAWWWRGLSMAIGDQPIESLLLRSRLAHAALFAAACALFAGIMAYAVPGPRPALTALGLMVVPTLPFFGMSMSDTSVVVAASLPLVALLAAVVLDSDRAHLLGAPIGLAMFAVVMSGRRVWPLLAAAALVLAGRALVGPRDRSVRHILMFWLGLLAILVPGTWLIARAGVLEAVAAMSARYQESQGLAAAIGWAAARPWLVVVAVAAVAAVDLSLHATVRAAVRVPRAWVWRTAGAIAAMAVIGPTLASRVVIFPTTAGRGVLTSSAGEYVQTTLSTMAVPFRLAHFDLLLSTLFWAGFGWSDTVPPESFIALLCLATSGMSAWLWWWAGSGSGPRQVVLLAALVLGLAASLAVAALGAHQLRYGLHGRYLIGWYLLWIVPAWAMAARTTAPSWVWIAGALLAHGYCLQLILFRYF